MSSQRKLRARGGPRRRSVDAPLQQPPRRSTATARGPANPQLINYDNKRGPRGHFSIRRRRTLGVATDAVESEEYATA